MTEVVEVNGAKSAALFPGQGSQYLGMGRPLYERSALVRKIFESAFELLGWNLWRLCDRGPEEKLRETSHSQPAIFTLSYAMYRLLDDASWKPDVLAGHSVGEFTALAASGALPFEDCLQVVAKRGELMADQSRIKPGAMLAVLGARTEAVEEKVRSLQGWGVIEIANYNCPGQVVVSLERGLQERAKHEFLSLAKRVVDLPVSGAFHSSLMREAQEKLAQFLSQGGFPFKRPRVPILLGARLAPSRDPGEIKEALITQMSAPVRWQQSVTQMLRSGVRVFVEVGPKDVLTKLVKRVDRRCLALAADGRELQEVIGALEVRDGHRS